MFLKFSMLATTHAEGQPEGAKLGLEGGKLFWRVRSVE